MAAEFIKTVEDGIEKSKTDHSPIKKQPKKSEKIEIKADSDDVGEPTEGTMFDNSLSEPTDDINTLKKQIVEKCTELGGQSNEKVMAVVKKLGNPNALKDIDDAKKYLEALNNIG